ncbi:hypothetical protein Nepgr_008183 [Nepenthes gracilis]|uniref:Uncharacterized protein n=1 Tax=Nepenthes gracilis TaxID=150966 RepID=A0AAD3XJ07_NEPGR|nr:hypothetical protein Nepgr_008183 [Nepenthes gracilis]
MSRLNFPRHLSLPRAFGWWSEGGALISSLKEEAHLRLESACHPPVSTALDFEIGQLAAIGEAANVEVVAIEVPPPVMSLRAPAIGESYTWRMVEELPGRLDAAATEMELYQECIVDLKLHLSGGKGELQSSGTALHQYEEALSAAEKDLALLWSENVRLEEELAS